MGNLKAKQANAGIEGYCYYSSNGQEEQVHARLFEHQLLLSQGQGHTVFSI
jgi:hypothetical protein